MKLRYAIGGMLIAVLLALPAGASAKGGGQVAKLAAQECKQERQELGRKGFRKRYGARNGMRNCVRRTRTRVTVAGRTAADACQAELAEIGETQFIEDYGSDETGFDAMEECIADGIDSILNPEAYEDDGSEIDDE